MYEGFSLHGLVGSAAGQPHKDPLQTGKPDRESRGAWSRKPETQPGREPGCSQVQGCRAGSCLRHPSPLTAEECSTGSSGDGSSTNTNKTKENQQGSMNNDTPVPEQAVGTALLCLDPQPGRQQQPWSGRPSTLCLQTRCCGAHPTHQLCQLPGCRYSLAADSQD